MWGIIFLSFGISYKYPLFTVINISIVYFVLLQLSNSILDHSQQLYLALLMYFCQCNLRFHSINSGLLVVTNCIHNFIAMAPRKDWTPSKRSRAVTRREEGYTVKEIATRLSNGATVSGVQKVWQRYKSTKSCKQHIELAENLK